MRTQTIHFAVNQDVIDVDWFIHAENNFTFWHKNKATGLQQLLKVSIRDQDLSFV